MNATDERAALLRAVLAEPEEGTPRLVFADFLQEAGEDDRAEFIRVQVELARVGGPDPFCMNCYGGGGVPKFPDGVGGRKVLTPCPGCHKKLRRRESDLLYADSLRTRFAQPGRRWLGGAAFWGRVRCTWRRGFVEDVSLDSEAWLAHASQILGEQPVRRVSLATGVAAWGSRATGDGMADYYLLLKLPGKREGKSVRMPRVGPTQRDAVRAVLEAEWPSISFSLPEDRIRAMFPTTHG